jgi:hypothetical protein
MTIEEIYERIEESIRYWAEVEARMRAVTPLRLAWERVAPGVYHAPGYCVYRRTASKWEVVLRDEQKKTGMFLRPSRTLRGAKDYAARYAAVVVEEGRGQGG